LPGYTKPFPSPLQTAARERTTGTSLDVVNNAIEGASLVQAMPHFSAAPPFARDESTPDLCNACAISALILSTSASSKTLSALEALPKAATFRSVLQVAAQQRGHSAIPLYGQRHRGGFSGAGDAAFFSRTPFTRDGSTPDLYNACATSALILSKSSSNTQSALEAPSPLIFKAGFLFRELFTGDEVRPGLCTVRRPGECSLEAGLRGEFFPGDPNISGEALPCGDSGLFFEDDDARFSPL